MSNERGMPNHSQAYTYCAFCPKMCRFSCPVSESTANESLSAWGKMSAAHMVNEGQRPMDAAAAKAVHACTGCGRCTSFCKHENQVGPALFAARTKAIENGVQPRGGASTVMTFEHSSNPFGHPLASFVASWRADSPVRYALFPGCSTLVKRPQLLEDVLAVARGFGAPMGVSKASSRCCGYPLYAAGAHAAFRRHARSVVEALASNPELVVLDPGCAYTFKVVYPQMGVSLPASVRTVVEVLAENLPHSPNLAPLDETIAYHDACHLGRGLGQYEEPRALMRKAVKTLHEAPSTRGEAGCAGGGGLLPRTMPDVAVDVARRLAESFAAPLTPIATACPTSKRMFERAGRTSYDLIALLRRWLESESAPTP